MRILSTPRPTHKKIKNMKNLYRKIFYHWKAKYLCPLGIHTPGGTKKYKNFVRKNYYTFVCAWCAKCISTGISENL